MAKVNGLVETSGRVANSSVQNQKKTVWSFPCHRDLSWRELMPFVNGKTPGVFTEI